jgi:hypothetical protein
MDSKQANTRNRADAARETLENKQTQLLEREAARQRAMVSAWVATTIVALVAAVTLLESCGSERTSVKPASAQHETTASQQQNVVASTDGLQGSVGSPLAQPAQTSDESQSVPPDAVVAVSDTFVTAGQPIEVVVQGTSDVSEMALSDGRGDALPMVRDSTADTWRVNYRVPLRPKTDRLGLAVTAKNDSHRWRRVWVFLQINDGKQQFESAAPDSSSSEDR